MATSDPAPLASSLVRIPYTSRHHGRDLGPYSVGFTVRASTPEEAVQAALEEFFAYRRRSQHTAILYPAYERITVAFAGGAPLLVSEEVLQSGAKASAEIWNR